MWLVWTITFKTDEFSVFMNSKGVLVWGLQTAFNILTKQIFIKYLLYLTLLITVEIITYWLVSEY